MIRRYRIWRDTRFFMKHWHVCKAFARNCAEKRNP